MRALNTQEMQAVAGGGWFGNIVSFAGHEIGATVLGAVTAGVSGAIIGGRHGGDAGGTVGLGMIGQLVGAVSGGVIGLGFGAIAAPLVGWGDAVKLSESAVQGIISGTMI